MSETNKKSYLNKQSNYLNFIPFLYAKLKFYNFINPNLNAFTQNMVIASHDTL